MQQGWNYLWVIIYSIGTIKFATNFSVVAKQYTGDENLKYNTEYEGSLATKTYILTCVNSYLGLIASIFSNSFTNMNLLLTTILMLKVPFLTIRKYKTPIDKFKPKWNNHTLTFSSHCRKYPDTYKADDTRLMHYEAERQLMLDPMPPLLIGHYNGLVIQYGWITLFAPAFPAGCFFLLCTCLLDL